VINTILTGDSKEMLKVLAKDSIDCVITSPPYFNLRDYHGIEGQIGLEDNPEIYTNNLIEVFNQVWRVMKKTATLWVVIGDSYAGSGKGCDGKHAYKKGRQPLKCYKGKPKSLRRFAKKEGKSGQRPQHHGRDIETLPLRTMRDVWFVSTRANAEEHYAIFPQKLIAPCVLCGCPEGGVILDPFFGAGTTGVVAKKHFRNYIGCELNPAYVEIAKKRIADVDPLFNNREEL